MSHFVNPKMPSNMTHSFSRVPSLDIPRSVFDRSRSYKTVFNEGLLIPFFADEVLPGDTLDLKLSSLVRMTTPLLPYMDNVWVDVHFFAVPNRILWDHWVNFMGEKSSPSDSTEYVTPKVTMTSASSGGNPLFSIYDYMGVRIGAEGNVINNFFGRAYNKIWNRFYRDQNLQDPVPEPQGDGPDNLADFVLLPRGKRHDYFTSCLPWPQKGPAVDIPLTGSAPVVSSGSSLKFGINSTTFVDDLEFHAGTSGGLAVSTTTSSTNTGELWLSTGAADTGLETDLSQVSAATINQLRQAFQVQALYEIDARGGTRYPEMILAHFGVTNPDFRMQYPEYIGGGTFPIDVVAVGQTSASESTGTVLGDLAGVATGVDHGIGFRHSFTEHSVVIGLLSVRADLTYQQGTHRMFYRDTRFDYYFPVFAHLGEQAVLNREIFTQGTAGGSADTEAFGYQEYAAEYRYGQSLITAQMRSDAPDSLDPWHLSQDFADLPVLGSDFIKEQPPISRVVAVQDEPHFRMDAYFKVKHVRPIPVYSIPGAITGRVL